ncbi:uncharacterized protein LOC143127865 [Alosa pseudoharengus]|uniref:uncharacterized protein LOC143127865 n=1 Tax=Alosa pseudoharengus TaxID=34774 RepID=UPI003F88FE66
MSRRKQKRPQQLINADPGGTRILLQDEQLRVKSPSTSLGSEAPSSSPSSSASPPSVQDCHPPLAPRPSPGGLHAPSLPSESSSPPHWPNHTAHPYSTALPNTHSSLSPDFPHPSLSSQTHSSPPAQTKANHASARHQSHAHHPHSHAAMMSPQLAISATTTTSSSSSSSSSSHGAAPHQGSPSPVQQAPSSPPAVLPPGQIQMPPTLAVLLEELRVLQQRQIHQMQITEEICRQVLRLGEGLNAPPQESTQRPGGALVSRQRSSSSNGDSGSPSPPHTTAPAVSAASSLLSSMPSLLSQASASKLSVSAGNGNRAPALSTASSSSALSTTTASLFSSAASPLFLSHCLPARYPLEKLPNASMFAHANGFGFSAAALAGTGLTHDSGSSSTSSSTAAAAAALAASSGRQQHACRYCGKVLSSDSSLQIHLRSHTGERPYQCPVCLSRFTTRGNLKAHFLRHREQNPELSLSLLPPALSEQSPAGSGGGGSSNGTSSRSRKRRAEPEEPFGIKGALGVPESMALSFLSSSAGRAAASSLPLPPSVDMALLSTAHSLLQLNRASSAAAAATTTSVHFSSPSSSASSASKGAKQQRFDENTPPHSALLSGSPYSQLAHLPKILFPTAAHHHPGLALLHPPPLPSPHGQLAFPFSPYPKPQASSSPSSTSPSPSSATSDTTKLQRLAQKLEKQPQGGGVQGGGRGSSGTPTSISVAASQSSDVTSTSSSSAYRREMMAALGLNPNLGSVASTPPSSSLTPVLSPNQCAVCLRVLSCPRALRLHQATHLGERPFPCKLCGRSFSTKGSLRAHVATHHSRQASSRPQNSCPLCQRKFTNAVVLQHHIRMHLGGQIPPDGGNATGEEEEVAAIAAAAVDNTEGLQVDAAANLSAVALGNDLVQTQPLDLGSAKVALLLSSARDGSVSRETLPADLSVKSDSDQSSVSPEPSPALSDEKAEQDALSLVVRPLVLSGPPITSPPTTQQQDQSSDTLTSDIAGGYSSTSRGVPSNEQAPHQDDAEDDMAPLSLCVRPDRSDSENVSLAKSPALAVNTVVKIAVVTTGDTPSTLTPPSSPSSDREANESRPDKNTSALKTAESAPDAVVPAVIQDGTHSPVEAEDVPMKKEEEEEEEKKKEETAKEIPEGSSAAAEPRGEEAEAPARREENMIDDGKGSEGTATAQPLTPVKTPKASRPEKPYSCSQCGKEYASRSGLKGHMKVHAGSVSNGPAVLASLPPSASRDHGEKGPLKSGKDTLDDPSAISTNSRPAEDDVEKPSANNCLSDEPMDTSGVAEKAE